MFIEALIPFQSRKNTLRAVGVHYCMSEMVEEKVAKEYEGLRPRKDA